MEEEAAKAVHGVRTEAKMKAEDVALLFVAGQMVSRSTSNAASIRLSNKDHTLHEDRGNLLQVHMGKAVVLPMADLLLRATHRHLDPRLALTRRDSTRYDVPFLLY